MTRRDEVEAQIDPGADDVLCFIWARDECLLLADELQILTDRAKQHETVQP
jgi:hypothetical protein